MDRVAAALELLRSGRVAQAIAALEQLVALDPSSAEAESALGTALAAAGRRTEAIARFRRAIALDPGLAKAHANLGSALTAEGDVDGAITALEEALRLNPGSHVAHANLGNAQRAKGDGAGAATAYRQALSIKADYLPALNNLGGVLMAAGDAAGAVKCFRGALRYKPGAPEVLVNLGNALVKQGEYEAAVSSLVEALERAPATPEAHNNLGSALWALGRTDEAIQAYERAIALHEEYAEAHANLGVALQEIGRLSEAMAELRRAIALRPGGAEAHSNLGGVLKDMGRAEDAIECFREALRLHPELHEVRSNLLCTLHYMVVDPDEVAREHRQFGALHADPLGPPSGASAVPLRRPLRVGYISRDLRAHAVGCFIEPVIAAHDRAAFEVIGYADVPRPDAVTARLRAAASGWREIQAMRDDEVAALVRRDGIDVLVDLGGHTAHNRLLVFARKPAPVQVTYLGYPDTTGMAAMDFRITDAEADPPGATERWHTEQLIRLPGGAWCYRPLERTPDVGALPAAASGVITFGSFNHFAKISPETIAMWGEVLLRVPRSRLLLKALALGDEAIRQELCERFVRLGVAAERLELLGWEPWLRDHLAAYGRVDIALDTYPYHGTTTTCEALWMGVPVVTLAGRTHVSRVGASLLRRVGLGHLVATDPGDYVATAGRLAADLRALAALRAGLRGTIRASPLCDGARLTHELESAYREVLATAR